jgi:hypothetical protein
MSDISKLNLTTLSNINKQVIGHTDNGVDGSAYFKKKGENKKTEATP